MISSFDDFSLAIRLAMETSIQNDIIANEQTANMFVRSSLDPVLDSKLVDFEFTHFVSLRRQQIEINIETKMHENV